MVFSSLLFTFCFVPVVIALVYAAGKHTGIQNLILLAASLFFYAYGEPRFVFVMLASIAANYAAAVAIDAARKREKDGATASLTRCLLWLSVALNLGLLFVFKYLNSVVALCNRAGAQIAWKEIALPIGISFFTFQAMSYVIDVYRGEVRVQKNPLYLALYISFFPQLIAGPIVRYKTIEEQIAERKMTAAQFAFGAKRFMTGFCKKVILANNLAVVAQAAMTAASENAASPALLWLGSICYMLQLFYDFAGYSDMAIGLGAIFGFTFEENFNYPYISRSISEFWRRWHISLGSWMRDYLFYPLLRTEAMRRLNDALKKRFGKKRAGRYVNHLAMFVLWFAVGLWHGGALKYVIGVGLLHWFYIVCGGAAARLSARLFRKREEGGTAGKPAPLPLTLLRILRTLLLVNISFVIFEAPRFLTGVRYVLAMYGAHTIARADDFALVIRYLREYGIYLAGGILFATPVMPWLAARTERMETAGRLRAVCAPLALGAVFLWGVSFIILGAHNPFIYFIF